MTHKDANDSIDEVPNYHWTISLDPSDSAYRWIRVNEGDLPCPIEIRIGAPQAGRFICTGLRIGVRDGEGDEYEVTSRMLRDVRLGSVLRMIREAFGGVGSDLLTEPNPPWDQMGSPRPEDWVDGEMDITGTGMSPEFVSVLKSAAGRSFGELMGDKAVGLSVRRGRKGLDPETLQRTAQAYFDAVAEGSTQPLAVAAQRLDIHPSTVWRRLQKAWDRFPELRPDDQPKRAKGAKP